MIFRRARSNSAGSNQTLGIKEPDSGHFTSCTSSIRYVERIGFLIALNLTIAYLTDPLSQDSIQL